MIGYLIICYYCIRCCVDITVYSHCDMKSMHDSLPVFSLWLLLLMLLIIISLMAFSEVFEPRQMQACHHFSHLWHISNYSNTQFLHGKTGIGVIEFYYHVSYHGRILDQILRGLCVVVFLSQNHCGNQTRACQEQQIFTIHSLDPSSFGTSPNNNNYNNKLISWG